MSAIGSKRHRTLMLLQNNSYPQDRRVFNEATSLHEAGNSVTVICPRSAGQPRHEVVNGVRCYRYRPAPAGDSTLGYIFEYGVALVMTWLLVLWVGVRHGFDVLHAHNPPDLFVLIAAPYKLIGKRFVFDHHDLAPEMYSARFPDGGKPSMERLLLSFERLTFRSADRVISTNDSYRQVAIERGGVEPHKVRVVRNGPDLRRFNAVPADPELAALEGTIMGYVGEMGVQDGLDHLLRALKHLRDSLSRDDFHCVLIGDGSDRPRLEGLATDLGLTSSVRFVGRQFGDDLLRHLGAADICVCPDPKNAYTDASTMIKIAEYMVMRKPIVAYDLRENRVTAGNAALYAQPNDELDFARKLEQLMDDPVLRESMGSVGRQRVESGLTWEHSVPELLATYDELGFAPIRRREVRRT